MPKFKGLQVETQSIDANHHRLILQLLDKDQREIFHRLCLDIVLAVESAQTEEQALQKFLNRTWRWHRLLKGVRDTRLSEEEQRGLYGELIFLEKYLFPICDVAKAIESWTGPLGHPQDFQVGQVYVEVKTKRKPAVSHVAISSELQLSSSEFDTLYLYVVEVVPADESNSEATTITQIADRIKSKIFNSDLSSIDQFEDLLVAAGFDWGEDYSDCYWLPVNDYVYKVIEGFPRVIPSMYPRGVDKLRYTISLEACEHFLVEETEIIKAVKNGLCARN